LAVEDVLDNIVFLQL